MNINKIANFIKTKRKELGYTQEQLANRLMVTEKAISRWETGRGVPDISLLIPLSKELKVEVSELLNGENNQIEKIIEYNEITKTTKFNFHFKMIFTFYILSILTFLFYLRFEYNPNVELNYFLRLILVVISSLFIVVGNIIYANNYVEKLEDKRKIKKLSQSIIFVYYIIFMFNMIGFARYSNINSYNLIPFKTIISLFNNKNIYSIAINILGNFLIFMPLEYFLVELFNTKRWLINFILSLGILITIETLQLIFKVGVFDIDDLILCISGMMIFYTFYIKLISRKNCIKKAINY